MTSLPIDGIELVFDGDWAVAKWDDARAYLNGIAKLNGRLDDRAEGTKAIDVVGLRGRVPFLFEVKDFRGVAIENQKRQLHELPLEVGLKARDTVAGVVGCVALDKQDELLHQWLEAARDRKIQVIALIAEDAARPGEPTGKRKIREDERAARIKQKLAWLTPRVLVGDPLRDPGLMARLGIVATSQPGAGPARA